MDEIKLSEKDFELAFLVSKALTKFDKYLILLKNDYGYSLTKAQVLDQSEQTIDRRIKKGINIPEYLRSGDSQKSSYNLYDFSSCFIFIKHYKNCLSQV